MILIIRVGNLRQLDRVIKKVSQIKSVDTVERMGR